MIGIFIAIFILLSCFYKPKKGSIWTTLNKKRNYVVYDKWLFFIEVRECKQVRKISDGNISYIEEYNKKKIDIPIFCFIIFFIEIH